MNESLHPMGRSVELGQTAVVDAYDGSGRDGQHRLAVAGVAGEG
jgi:hypothetical protein